MGHVGGGLISSTLGTTAGDLHGSPPVLGFKRIFGWACFVGL
eukprot:gene2569-2947_t